MTATWEIETQTIPHYINKNKSVFFENIFLYSEEYFADIFNAAFKMFFANGKLTVPIKYEVDEFYCSIEKYNEIERVIYIELPEPRKSDFSYNMYVKAYFIPYRLKKNGIEIYDMYGVDAIDGMNTGLIVWYKNSQHMISNLKLPVDVNNRNDLIAFMSKYIFDRI